MIKTEMRNVKTTYIDKMDTLRMLQIINEENMYSVKAVEAAIPEIEKAVDAVTEAFNNDGRLFYIGAGTSGRIAVSDAAECPPTFGVSYNMVNAIMAGGNSAIFKAAENVEDSAEAGKKDILAQNINSNDIVMGISASGNAEYVYSALIAAKESGCTTISLSCNSEGKINDAADIKIVTDTGAEVVTGSTRMKAGNAQKMVMNMITTSAMIKTGKVYENMMINLKPTNKKLRQRMIGIVNEITKCGMTKGEELLEKADWNIKEAVKIYQNK